MPTPSPFSADIVAAAQASQAKWDVPASVCLAQWALESAYGKAMPPDSNNPFGIKAVGSEPAVACPTHEVVDGRRIAITARFRAFPSLVAAFEAHGELLATAQPYAAARRVRHDAEAFARALTGVYATDPNYGAKLIELMRAHSLEAFDMPAADAGAAPSPSRVASPADPVEPAAAKAPPPIPAPPPSSWRRLCALFIRKA